MSLFLLGPQCGPILGPVLGGLLAGLANWRWIFGFLGEFASVNSNFPLPNATSRV
jgi:MFS family permease